MKKITPLKSLSLLITLFCAVNFGFGQTKIAELTFETAGGYTTSITEFTNGAQHYFLRTDGSDITGETFFNTQGSYYFTAQNIDEAPATLPVSLLINDININGYSSLEFRVHLAADFEGASQDWDNDDYVHFNYDIDNTGTFSNLLWLENNNTGNNNEPLIDTNYDGTGDGSAITSTFTQYTQSITGSGSLVDIEIIFSLDHQDEDIAIDNIEIWGILGCGALVTWDGASSTWSNGSGPVITNEVEINGLYNTNTHGDFSACSLTINSGASLTIADNTYVEVQNDLTVDGTITVQPYGAFIQNNDAGLVTNNGTTTVVKKTAPMNNWYEYTYWSSPVSGETIGLGLNESQYSRRFTFNASQFNDAFAETGNNNTFLPGQDDIDDEGDDWEYANASSIMQPGVGYASTHAEALFFGPPFSSPPYQFDYTFEGPLNNGVYNVTVDRNNTTTADFNWNFIGNPFPSPIDVDAFMTQNMYDAATNPSGTLDGAIYLWSQNTDRADNANGNEAYNFATSDYAAHNGVTGTAGGDGLTPNDFIPSGQGFFVSFSDSAPSSTGTVVFNNAMRSLSLSPDNSQFFKNSSSKRKSINNNNKLWLNLTSDNGVFNQIAIGYVNGATNNDDGAYYDARKIVAPNTFAALYSIIENSDKKYVIQGKDINSINEDELINLGFSTTIDVATLYTLSIAQFEGDFLSNNPIYLKDNLLNQLHDLSASDYTFTSEVGEFNDRFEIVFNSAALSTTDVALNSKSLRIIELEDDRVQFTASDNLKIKSVNIFDLLGRQLYCFKGNSPSETYTLSNLNSSIYIAKVALSNGVVVTKKAIKK